MAFRINSIKMDKYELTKKQFKFKICVWFWVKSYNKLRASRLVIVIQTYNITILYGFTCIILLLKILSMRTNLHKFHNRFDSHDGSILFIES